MPYAMASMGGLIGSSQTVLECRLQISGSRLNTVSTSRIALSRPAGLSVRAEQGSFDTETSRRAVLSHVAAGLAGTFANAAFAEARSIKGVPPPPLFGGLHPPPKFDDKGNLIDEETKKRLKEILLALQAFAVRLGGNCK
ncbi:Oxygen-evolving enhancer protein 3-2, chloroplastic [Capsicum chinense]|nr:Oxygen-evolving enhancer protein 3-2, chloroplastic [Capsicum chinense]